MATVPLKPQPCPRCGTVSGQLLPGVYDCLRCGRVTFADERKAELRGSPQPIRRCKKYALDDEAVAFPGQFSPTNANPKALSRALDRLLSHKAFDRDAVCERCHEYDRKMEAINSSSEESSPEARLCARPFGTLDRDSCAGCVLSLLDKSAQPPSATLENFSKLQRRIEALRSLAASSMPWSEKRRVIRRLDRDTAMMIRLARRIRDNFPAFSHPELMSV